MLNYIMEDERLYEIKGMKLWREMEDLEITKHTSQSMKYRFLNTVIKNLNCYKIKESWVHRLHSRYPDLVNPKCYQESTKTRSVLEWKNPPWSLVRSQPKTHADKEPQLTHAETRAADEEEQQQRDRQQDMDCSDSKASDDFEISKPKVVPKKRTTRHNLSYSEVTSSSADEDPEIDVASMKQADPLASTSRDTHPSDYDMHGSASQDEKKRKRRPVAEGSKTAAGRPAPSPSQTENSLDLSQPLDEMEVADTTTTTTTTMAMGALQVSRWAPGNTHPNEGPLRSVSLSVLKRQLQTMNCGNFVIQCQENTTLESIAEWHRDYRPSESSEDRSSTSHSGYALAAKPTPYRPTSKESAPNSEEEANPEIDDDQRSRLQHRRHLKKFSRSSESPTCNSQVEGAESFCRRICGIAKDFGMTNDEVLSTVGATNGNIDQTIAYIKYGPRLSGIIPWTQEEDDTILADELISSTDELKLKKIQDKRGYDAICDRRQFLANL